LLTKSCAELSVSEDVQRVKNILKEVIKKGFVENFEKTCIVKDGRKLGVNLSLSLLPDKNKVLLVAKDITIQKKNKKALDEYIKIVDQNVLISSTDLKGNITYVSEAFCKICGYSKEELLGQNHNIIRHPDVDKNFYKQMWDSIKSSMIWNGEIKNQKKNGDFYWVEASISPTYDEYGEKTGYTSIRHNITDKKALETLSITDGLTNIYNRRYFDEIFLKVINSAKRNTKIECFMLIDIDNFKLYNDTYGHQRGDEVLIQVASTLKASLHRTDDYCFRLGGEEFGVLFKTDSKEKAIEFANKVKTNIENLQIEHKENNITKHITISAGLVCIKTNETINLNKIYKQTDDLLYKAKNSGRNKIIWN
jgi:diguanylate cyclase (GGDEF)-like protein/PAS domain S-box-containing protein